MLTALAAAKRCGELANLKCGPRQLCIAEDKVVFFFDQPSKTQKHRVAPPLSFPSFEDDKNICPVSTIKCYLSRTEELRDPSKNSARKHDSFLFIATLKPHNSVKRCTIASWIKHILSLSGVDTSIFKCHSVRSASTSKAKAQGASLPIIMQRANWSSKYTWQSFYNKDIVSNEKIFQDAVLGSSL